LFVSSAESDVCFGIFSVADLLLFVPELLDLSVSIVFFLDGPACSSPIIDNNSLDRDGSRQDAPKGRKDDDVFLPTPPDEICLYNEAICH
jgi:hypothetical protein